MMEEPQIDPMGSLIVEIRDDIDVDALVDGRVRSPEPAPGDIQPHGSYKAFVVIVLLDDPPEPRVPVTFASYAIRAYGVTPQGARAVWGAVVKAVHMVGARVKANGLGIYQTRVVSGGTQDTDPDTKQPLVTGTVQLIGTTVALG